jgi:hypothetical protein
LEQPQTLNLPESAALREKCGPGHSQESQQEQQQAQERKQEQEQEQEPNQ